MRSRAVRDQKRDREDQREACQHPNARKSYEDSPYQYCPDCGAVKTKEGWHTCDKCRLGSKP